MMAPRSWSAASDRAPLRHCAGETGIAEGADLYPPATGDAPIRQVSARERPVERRGGSCRWRTRSVGRRETGRRRDCGTLERGAGAVWIIGGVDIATGCQAGHVRRRGACRLGSGIDGQRAGERHRRAQIRRDRRQVVHRLVRQGGGPGQVLVQPVRPGVVGSQEGRRTVTVIHLPDIRRACQDVVVRVIRVAAQVVALAQRFVRRGDHLHQPHRTGG